MNKKQSMKYLMIFAAGIIICSTMVLTSCSDDNPVVVTDDKPWTISTDDMDPNVRPGDDFFMHCNGGYYCLYQLIKAPTCICKPGPFG